MIANNFSSLLAQTITLELMYSIDIKNQGDLILGEIGAGLLDNNNQVFLVDNGNKKVHHFDSAGKIKHSFGGEGRGPGEFLNAAGASLSSDSKTLYLLDYPNARVVLFETDTGTHKKTINFQSTTLVPINDLIEFNGKMILLGSHQGKDQMLNVININGETEYSLGEFIDFNNFIHNNSGKMQLSVVHASIFEDLLLVSLAAPNRMKLYDSDLNVLREFEDDLLPKPWEKHMIMRPDRYRTTFYSMGLANQILSDETYLFYWLEVIDPKIPEVKKHLELRSLKDGKKLASYPVEPNISILDIIRESNTSATILTRNIDTYNFEVYKVNVGENGN
ncbi:MAG: 6-bladed beta-propeller [Balneolaceae bacterium]